MCGKRDCQRSAGPYAGIAVLDPACRLFRACSGRLSVAVGRLQPVSAPGSAAIEREGHKHWAALIRANERSRSSMLALGGSRIPQRAPWQSTAAIRAIRSCPAAPKAVENSGCRTFQRRSGGSFVRRGVASIGGSAACRRGPGVSSRAIRSPAAYWRPATGAAIR